MLNVNVQDIKKGDEFRENTGTKRQRGWNALADAGEQIPMLIKKTMASNEVAIRVQLVPEGETDFLVFAKDRIIAIHSSTAGTPEYETSQEESAYQAGFKAGINAVLDRLSQDQYTGAVAGPNIRKGLANEMRNHFKTEGKI